MSHKLPALPSYFSSGSPCLSPMLASVGGGKFDDWNLAAESEGKLNLDPEKDMTPSSNPASARCISYAVNIPKIYGEIKSEINAAKNQFKKENPVLMQLKGNGTKGAGPENVPLREGVSPGKK